MQGLINALLLSVVASIPLSFTYDDLVAANERYSAPPYLKELQDAQKREFSGYDGLISNRLSAFVALSFGFLVASLLAIVITYTFAASRAGLQNPKNMQYWWPAGRWIVLFQVATTIAGIIFG